MRTTITSPAAGPAVHALALAAIALEGAALCVRALLVPAVALVLTVAGYRPAPAAAAPVAALPPASVAAAPVAALPPAALLIDASPLTAAEIQGIARPLERLTVRELRQIARGQGHKALARSGRRADLLAVLAGEG